MIFKNSTKIKLGAQNCWYEDEGSFTREISPRDLKEIGCKYLEIDLQRCYLQKVFQTGFLGLDI
ncbi:MAG: triose-phosphate isomerase [Actinobacteria bacterium]|nr:triose-phosphate isomerase [Actinomycetota bacterium]